MTMIALYSLPGARNFTFRRVATRAEGEAWLDQHMGDATQESLNDRRQSSVISNREAAKLRWRDGSKIVGKTGEYRSQENYS